MPRRKHLKRLVRARMSKTGESYVTALAEMQGRRPVAPFPISLARAKPEERKLERLLTGVCSRLGCAMTPDPPVPREWALPAFLVQPGAGADFYLDLVVAPPDGEVKAGPVQGYLVSEPGNIQKRFVPGAEMRDLAFGHLPRLPLAVAVSRAGERLIDPDLPYVVAVAVDEWSGVDAGVIEVWTGSGGPRLHVSALLVVQMPQAAPPVARLYHHPEPRRPVTAAPLLRLPQAVWAGGRYVMGAGESLASLLGEGS